MRQLTQNPKNHTMNWQGAERSEVHCTMYSDCSDQEFGYQVYEPETGEIYRQDGFNNRADCRAAMEYAENHARVYGLKNCIENIFPKYQRKQNNQLKAAENLRAFHRAQRRAMAMVAFMWLSSAGSVSFFIWYVATTWGA